MCSPEQGIVMIKVRSSRKFFKVLKDVCRMEGETLLAIGLICARKRFVAAWI